MKKLFYLFLLLPFSLLMSCSDDKDLSPVDMTLTLSGVSQSGNSFYTVAGENVTVDSFQVKSIDGKNTAVTNVVITLGNYPIFGDPAVIETENLPAGEYNLAITGNLLQVDSSIKVFAINYPLTIVESAEDLPAGAQDLGTYSQTIRVSEK